MLTAFKLKLLNQLHQKTFDRHSTDFLIVVHVKDTSMVHMCNQGCFCGIFLSTETELSSYMFNYIGWKIKKDNY